MLSNLKKYIFFLFLGIVVGIVLSILIDSKFIHPKGDSSKIEVKTISGDPLVIKEISYKDKTTTINTKYAGEGQSEIVIPNSSNPSANAWDNYRWGVGSMISTDKTFSLMGSYRYERFMALGSIWCRNKDKYEFGASVGAMYVLGR